MEKVVYLVTFDSDESFETDMIEEARYARQQGASVLEIRETEWYTGRVHVEVRTSTHW